MATAVCAVALGVLYWNGAIRRREIISRISQLGGLVTYDYQQELMYSESPEESQSYVPDFLLNALGKEFFHRVIQISFRWGDISASDLDAGIQEAVRLNVIEDLELGGDNLSDNHLSPLRNASRIKCLTIWGGDISDEGIVHISKVRSVEVLHLVGMENASADGLRPLAQLDRLRFLKVDGTATNQETLVELRTRLPDCEICINGIEFPK